MMRKKSFGKLAVVFALAALMLFGLCVCSKAKDTTSGTTTTQAAATTETTATTTAKEAETTKVEIKVEEPVVEVKVEETAVETKDEEPVVEVTVEEPVVEVKVEETAVETKVEEPVVEEKAEEPAPETKTEESAVTTETEEAVETVPVEVVSEDETLQVADDGTISGTYSYADLASASFVMEGSKATITYPAQYVYKEDIESFMALCVEKYPEYLGSVYYEIPQDGTLIIYYPEEFVGGLYYRLGVLDYLNGIITSYIDAFVESVISEAAAAVEEEEEVEDVSVDKDFVYSYTLDYKGVVSSINAHSTYAEVTVPEGMTDADLEAVKDMLVAEYPAEASIVTYSLDNGTLTLTYPEQSSEFIIAVVNVLRNEAVALIDSIAPEAVVEEVPASDGHVYAETLTYKGLSTTVTVDSTKATLTVPSAIDKDDIDAVAYIVCAAYPEEASLVTYSFENGVLTLTYPEQSDEFLLSIMETLKEGGMYLIDLYGEVETAVTETVDAVVETVEQVAEVVETVVDTAKALVEGFDLVVEEDGTIRATFNYHDFAYATVVVEENSATITYPSEYIASSDIDAFMAAAVEEFPALLENVYYDVPEDGTLVIYFPADYVGGTYYRLEVLDELDEEVTAYIDALVAALEEEASEEEVVVEAVVAVDDVTAVEEAPVYADTLTYEGVTSTIEINKTYATFTIPEGMTEEDIEAVAWFINYLYPEEAALLTYSVDGDTLTVTYPEQTGEFLLAALDVIEADAVTFIDDLYAEEEEVVVAVVEDKTADKEAPVYADTLTYEGVTSTIEINKTYATFTIPEGMTEEDVEAVAWFINYLYPEEAALLTYSVDGDTITVTYPEQTGEFLLAALDVLEADAVAFIDDLYAEEEEVVVAVVEEKTEETASVDVTVVKETAETAPVEAVVIEKGPVFEGTYSHKFIDSDVTVYNDYAVVTLPEGITAEDIEAVVEAVNRAYPDKTTLVAYKLSENTLILYYPEVSDAFLLGAVNDLKAKADSYIDSLYEEAKAKAKAEAKAPAEAEAKAPAEAEAKAPAEAEAKAPAEAEAKAPTEAEAKAPAEAEAKAPAEAEAKAPAEAEAKAPAEAEAKAKAEAEAKAKAEAEAKAKAEAEAESREEEAEEKAEEIPPVAVAPPVSVKKESAFRGFSIAATATPKYNFESNGFAFDNAFALGLGLRAEAQFGAFSVGLKGQYEFSSYIQAVAYGRWTFVSAGKADFYALLGGGATFGVADKFGEIDGLAEIGLGVDYRFTDHFSLFGEVTGQWSIPKPGIEVGGTVGLKFTF